MNKIQTWWKELEYEEGSKITYLAIILPPLIFTIIPGFFGYVNIITAYHWWIYEIRRL
jgi:hypothetical protein